MAIQMCHWSICAPYEMIKTSLGSLKLYGNYVLIQ